MQPNALIRAEKESSSLMDLKHRHPGAAPGAPQPSCTRKLLVLKKWSGTLADFEPHSPPSHLSKVVSAQEGS